MTKRKPLTFDSKSLSTDLKESTGQGVDALFSPTPAAPLVANETKVSEESKSQNSSKEKVATKKKKPITPDEKPSPKKKTKSRNLDNYISRNLSRNLDSYIDYLRPYLDSSGVQINFNYPQELIDRFDDLVYELNRVLRRKKRKQKLTKTKVLVAALAYIIWDYEVNKNESILQKIIDKESG